MKINKAVREFLDKPLPEGIGWPHVFGSMLLAVLSVQFITGLLLSFVYAPSPLSAYRSVHYIAYDMDGGAWLRGVHFWGASFLVVLLLLHLVRTFLHAAYRKPRQFTWIAGVLLLFCVLAFAQTGYLLAWDQKAYWGTTVTLRIVGAVPWVGPRLAFLLRGGESVGALTLSRFYSIHATILPLILCLLVAVHLFLVRRHGITAPWTDAGAMVPRRDPFYPRQMAKDAMAMFAVLLLLFFFASQLPSPLGRPADPTDNTFTPRPDWYFLFLFQSLHYFPGSWEVVGAFVLPFLGTNALLFLPFYDRNRSRLLRRRPIALLALVIPLVLMGYLTYEAKSELPRASSRMRPAGILLPRVERIKRPSEVGGLYVLQQNCFSCHSLTPLGLRSNLQTLARVHFPTGGTWLQQHLQEKGSTAVLSDKEVEELMSVLRIVAQDDASVLYTIPKPVRFGANMFYNKSCFGCHRIDGQGGASEHHGPDLTLRLLRPKQWHVAHIHDAQSVVPNSKMPPFFHYEPSEYDALAEYILYLHTP